MPVDIVVWRAASLLLAYPDQRFYDRRPMLRAALADVPRGAPRRCLNAFLDHVDRTTPIRLTVEYREVCGGGRLNLAGYRDLDEELRRFMHGHLAELYRQADYDAGEEPADSLPVVLEYAALCRDDWLLRANRAALESLHAALEADGTPYATLIEGVRATLAPRVTRAAILVAGQATFSDELEDDEDEDDSEEDEDELSDFDDESDLSDLAESLDEVDVELDVPELRLSVR